ncbi:SRPBCC family protein [Puniceibacterium antarcticum]|uniref:SRPBCC family protein n=1 Tax=Puniceibacterium antarcticum TaxID=1206336 RepID=UPI0015D47CAD|nr:SRPBCC family protein [Puniceibacterium antarcticum]
MNFTAQEDIKAPLDQVFAELSDFEAILAAVTQQGGEVQRTDDGDATGVGSRWSSAFELNDKMREITVTLTEYVPPNAMAFVAVSAGIELQARVDLVALTSVETRVDVVVDMLPKTMSARLLMQPMKLARGKLADKFQSRVKTYAKELETRLNHTA